MAAAEDVRYGIDLAGVDPASLTGSLADAAVQLAAQPHRALQAFAELSLAQSAVALDVARHVLGADGEPVAKPDPRDRRFDDRAWKENPFLRGLLESYLVSLRSAHRLLDSLNLPEPRRRKAHFALGLLFDALAPTNVPWLNPAVVKEAIDTGGLSVARGMANFVDDLVRNGGQPRQVDTDAFEVGRNLAATPGRVVFKNELIELIAYEPRAERVFAEPIVYSPPWINKYYLMDLAPGRSFVEYALGRGFTVFAISYRNADESMAGVTLDDYLRNSLLAAVGEASRLTGGQRVNVLGVCVGGTLAFIGVAVLAARGEAERIGWTTLANTLVDFNEPGDIAVFTDEATIERIEQRMSRRGYLAPSEMSGPFTWMKGNDLVWRYVVSNWQMGKPPPAFDILAWNADATRLPAKMHSQYLRTCYLDNLLVRPDAFVIDGTPVDGSRVETPLYVLGSKEDHIVPWRSSYATTQLVSGEVRYTLTSGGHIAGLVNPPASTQARYWVRDDCPPDPDAWLQAAQEVRGSWWEGWADWASERSGELVEPPMLPEGDPAPGTYVRG
jgi:polyhydroxyalkanoate synthase subunit PhaC